MNLAGYDVSDAIPLPAKHDYGIGVVGCGGIVNYAHLPAYRRAGLRVVACYDQNREAAERTAAWLSSAARAWFTTSRAIGRSADESDAGSGSGSWPVSAYAELPATGGELSAAHQRGSHGRCADNFVAA